MDQTIEKGIISHSKRLNHENTPISKLQLKPLNDLERHQAKPHLLKKWLQRKEEVSQCKTKWLIVSLSFPHREHILDILWHQILPRLSIADTLLTIPNQHKVATLGGTSPCQAEEQQECDSEGTSKALQKDLEKNSQEGVGFQIHISDSSRQMQSPWLNHNKCLIKDLQNDWLDSLSSRCSFFRTLMMAIIVYNIQPSTLIRWFPYDSATIIYIVRRLDWSCIFKCRWFHSQQKKVRHFDLHGFTKFFGWEI